MPNQQLDRYRLVTYFTEHLNRICCAKKHMLGRFPELAALATFNDLKYAIDETTTDVRKQITRMEKIFDLLNTQPSNANCIGMTGVLDEAFEAISRNGNDDALRDLAILFYMQIIESIEMASFHVMRLAGKKLGDPEVTQLLQENLDESTDDRSLLSLINAKYLADN